MRPLFPPWSDTVFRVCVTVTALGVVAVPTAMMLWVRTPYVTQQGDALEQPIQFDHRHHVRDDGIDCLYCHYEATRSAVAGVPPVAVCMNCHSQVWQEAGRLAPVRAAIFDGEPLRWRRVHQLPQFVYFDHSAHVTHGVGCAECHGRVDRMPAVYAVAPLTMSWCIDCHRDPVPHLRPPSEITNMEWEPQGSRRAAGEAVAATLHVAAPITCSACHR